MRQPLTMEPIVGVVTVFQLTCKRLGAVWHAIGHGSSGLTVSSSEQSCKAASTERGPSGTEAEKTQQADATESPQSVVATRSLCTSFTKHTTKSSVVNKSSERLGNKAKARASASLTRSFVVDSRVACVPVSSRYEEGLAAPGAFQGFFFLEKCQKPRIVRIG